MIRSVSVREVEQVAFRLAREKVIYDEPIPGFETRFPNILESCLAVPFQQFDKKSLYKTLSRKAAVLFYLMIKNHPFQNGNKRIAMTTLFYFLYKNNKWLRMDNKKLYNFAVWLAESPAELKDDSIRAAKKFIKTYLVKR
jgi:death-on-curing family protein